MASVPPFYAVLLTSTATVSACLATLLDQISRIVHHANFPFVFLFLFRYLRLIVHILAFHCLYRATPIPEQPTYHRSDVTVIVPTVDPDNADFAECITSILHNAPGAIFIVTVGPTKLTRCRQIAASYQQAHPNTTIHCIATTEANKRRQVCHALRHVRTLVTILADDHVFWPSGQFLPTILAPFEDPLVGVVGTNKRVRRQPTGVSWKSFWNFLGALYLERHNFEIRATNALDGGVFVVSGRTSAHRTAILQDRCFISKFVNERFFFGLFGPLNADDDNFITRWYIQKGYRIKIQYGRDAMIETTLGTYPKFLAQCLRWVRTTWRSNTTSLRHGGTNVWFGQPWCVYAVYLTSFVNFALGCDAALVLSVLQTNWVARFGVSTVLKYLAIWILLSKLVKPLPHFWRHPGDLLFLPGYLLFGYGHGLIKAYALLTFWVTAWGGRDLGTVVEDDHLQRPVGGCGGVGGGSGSVDSDEDNDSHDGGSRPDAANGDIRREKPQRGPGLVETPWGMVRTGSRSTRTNIPANVLEGSLSGRYSGILDNTSNAMADARFVPKLATKVSNWDAPETVDDRRPETLLRQRRVWIKTDYRRSWTRGQTCERLHDLGLDLGGDGQCLLGASD